MRIALMHPCYWPEVRRGSERLIHDLGSTLATRGHEVTLITSHPGPGTVTEEEGVRVIRTRRVPPLRPLRWYPPHVDSVPAMVWRLLRHDYDVAHTFLASYAWAAVKARALGGPPVVYSFHGIPVREDLVGRRYALEVHQQAVAGASARTVLSEAAAEQYRRYLLTDPTVLPGGVLGREFAVDAPRAEAPTLICASSLGDPRKRGELLFAAFSRARVARPDLRLRVVRTPDPFLSTDELELPEGAEWVDANGPGGLARGYASAWASVMPAPREAFGLVILESLAAGTPVVAARSGGCPEIVSEDAIGRLFEPDDEGDLVKAIDEALALATLPQTAVACQRRAAVYDWSRVISRYEAVYHDAAADGGRDLRGMP